MPLIYCPNGYCDSIGNGCCFTKNGECEQDCEHSDTFYNKEENAHYCENCGKSID